MEQQAALSLAKEELMESLERLPPDARFGVVFYNLEAEALMEGSEGLVAATRENKELVRGRLRGIRPYGGTDHVTALRAGLRYRPEVIFFLTDAQRMLADDVARIQAEAGGRTRIQAIEFGEGPALGTRASLEELARGTGGTYRYIDVAAYRRGRAGMR
jgi:hypothetical protein